MRKIKIKVAKKRKEAQLIFLLFFIIALFIIFLWLSFFYKKHSCQTIKAKPTELNIPKEVPSNPLQEEKIIIKNGMTLTYILSSYNFTPVAIGILSKKAKPVYDLAKIKAGHEVRLYFSPQKEFISLEYDIDPEHYLLIQTKKDGYQADIKKFPVVTKPRMIWGTINDNLIEAVNQKWEKDYLALSVAEIFAWDIDFYTDLRSGDSFKIIFEKKYLKGESVGYGHILAASFTNQGKTFEAYRYTYPDSGESDYFDLEGNSLRKEFLKSPIKFARITSCFSFRRLHPIFKIYRPHYGVDYAAKVGTPVQATADGIVTFVGWNGASGRMIKIRHSQAYETLYLHLRNYAKGIRKGAKVKGGQIIGFVGSSGESTGPHLDYRIRYRGKYINPLAWRFKPVNPLRREYFQEFKAKANLYRFFLQTPLALFRMESFPKP